MASAAPAVRLTRTPQPTLNSSRHQLARTLDDLVQMGFIERYRDEHNVTRYRPRLVAKRREA